MRRFSLSIRPASLQPESPGDEFELVAAQSRVAGADLVGGCKGYAPPPNPLRDDLRLSNTTSILRKRSGLLMLK